MTSNYLSGEEFPAGKLTVKGSTFDIFTTDAGNWFAYVQHNRVQADTKKELQRKIGRKLAAAKITVAVPFMMIDHRSKTAAVRRGVATGIHSSSRNVLVRWSDGETGELSRYAGGQKFLADDDGDAIEYARLRSEYVKASRAYTDFEEEHKFDLAKKVQAEVDAAVKDEDGDDA